MPRRMFRKMVAPSVTALLILIGTRLCSGPKFRSCGVDRPSELKRRRTYGGRISQRKRAGSTITITVVSNDQGRYSFPAKRLEPGRYSLRIRAVGYELDDPGPVEITAPKGTSLDLKLRKREDFSSQLTNTEWMMSIPGTQEQKTALLNCVYCHTLERIVRSHHDAAEWTQVLQRMGGYYVGSTSLRPQRRQPLQGEPHSEMEDYAARTRPRPEYLSSINLSSSSKWQFPSKTLPRPKDRSTRVIITEYDLPRPDTQPHDAVVDSQGIVWYADFGHLYVGRLDSKTAQVVEYPVPELKPGFPQGILDVDLDKAENVWFGMMVQVGIGKFDRKTQKLRTWSLPKEVNNDVAQVAMVMPWQQDVDSKVWTNSVGLAGLHRLDIKSGEIGTFQPFRSIKDSRHHTVYSIAADSQNNIYFLDNHAENIGRIDAKTGKVTFYPTPTPDSGPRRGHMDSQNQFWFAESRGNKIGMFDTRTEQFKEWAIPTPGTQPYDAVVDKNGDVWTGGDQRSRLAAGSADQSVHGIFSAPVYQHSASVCRQFPKSSFLSGGQ